MAENTTLNGDYFRLALRFGVNHVTVSKDNPSSLKKLAWKVKNQPQFAYIKQ